MKGSTIDEIPPDELEDIEPEEDLEEIVEEVPETISLADEPLFVWLLRQAVQKTMPGDQVLLDYVTYVTPALSEYLALKPAKGGREFLDARRADGKSDHEIARYRQEQSLRAHLVNGLLPAAHVARLLHQWQAPRFSNWDEQTYRLFCAGFTLHDWVKLPDVENELKRHNLTHDKANAALHLSIYEAIFRQWGEKLGLTRFLEPIGGLEHWLHDVIYLAVNAQVRWGTMLNLSSLPRLRLPGRVRTLATDLCTFADRIAYIAKTPVTITGTTAITELVQDFSNGTARLVYHHIAENRGVITNFIHNAAMTAIQSENCVPLLFAPSGVVYLAKNSLSTFPEPADIAKATIERIRKTCSQRIHNNFVGFSRDGKGLKTAPYYDLHLSPAGQIRLTAQAVFGQIPDTKKPSSNKRFSKITEKGWLADFQHLTFAEDIRVDQLAEFCAFVERIAQTNAPELDTTHLLLTEMGLISIRPQFDQLAKTKGTGGVAYQWYFVAGYYVTYGSGRSQDPSQWRQFIQHLAEKMAQTVETQPTKPNQPDGWEDMRSYIQQHLTFGPTNTTKILTQIHQELTRYQGAKSKGRKATQVCSLCSSAYTINPQREAGILFSPQVYTNKQPLHGSKAIRQICQICETEMMLRQILMNRGGSAGGRFEGRKFRYLYLYPTYFFTPETLVQLQLIYDRLKRISFTNLRKALQIETDDTTQLRLDVATLQRLQDLMVTPDRPEKDTLLFRIQFPENDPITLFFIGLPPPERDAKDAEAWVNPAWLALILPLVLDVKVVATESPLPLLHEADELDETLFFDAPHDFVATLVGRERVHLEGLLLRLRALTVAYMVHMDGNADLRKGEYRWHLIPLLARRLAETPLWATAYLKKWQRAQDTDPIPRQRVALYHQYIAILNQLFQQGGIHMTHAQKLTLLYRQFYRHSIDGRLNANKILRPLSIASKALLSADSRLFPDQESQVEIVQAEVRSFMERVANKGADGRFAPGSNWESRDTAIAEFSRYFVAEIYWHVLGHDLSALRGKQLNLLKNACELVYLQEENKERRIRGENTHLQEEGVPQNA